MSDPTSPGRPGAYLVGNSHVICLRGLEPELEALDARAFALGNGKFETEPFSHLDERGRVVVEPEPYRLSVGGRLGEPVIDPTVTWGFLQIGHSLRLFRDPTWRTHAPAAVAGDLQPVSARVLEAIIERDHLGLRLFYDQLLTAGVRFFAIAAPAPRREHPVMTRKGVRPEVVATIDRAGRDVWRRWLGERGIPLVEAPAESTDADGFLLPHLAAGPTPSGTPDFNHANSGYGRLLLPGIERALLDLGDLG